LAYVVIGIVSGLVGGLMDFGGDLVGIQQTATKIAGIGMIAVGLSWLARRWWSEGLKISGMLPVMGARLGQGWLSRHKLGADWSRFLVLGVGTTFMPCGWLYVFAITAAGTGSSVRGAAMMSVFWVGTLPALVALGAGLGRLSASVKRFVPHLMAVLVILVGLFTVIQRAPIDPTTRGGADVVNPASPVPCHEP
jgi:hypothetical protein